MAINVLRTILVLSWNEICSKYFNLFGKAAISKIHSFLLWDWWAPHWTSTQTFPLRLNLPQCLKQFLNENPFCIFTVAKNELLTLFQFWTTTKLLSSTRLGTTGPVRVWSWLIWQKFIPSGKFRATKESMLCRYHLQFILWI